MDPFSIGLMIASAALGNYAQNQALKQQQREAVLAQQRQLNARNQATDVAMRQVQEFDPTTRQQRQQDIGQNLETQYNQVAQAPAVTAQGVQVGQTIQGGSADYQVAQAREQAKTAQSLRTLASLFGRIGSANELRRGEAVGLGDAAGQIGRIQTGANNIAGIDKFGIEAAGQPSVGAMAAASALGNYGLGSMAMSGIPRASGTPIVDNSGALGTGTWFPQGSFKKGTLGGALGSGTWQAPGSLTPY